MKVVFKVMSEKQKEKEVVVEKEEKGRDVFRINSEVRPMVDSIEAVNGEEGRKETTRGRKRKERRRGRKREEVMRREKEEEQREVKERRSEWRREEPLAKPSLTGGAALEKAPFASWLLLAWILTNMPHLLSSTTV